MKTVPHLLAELTRRFRSPERTWGSRRRTNLSREPRRTGDTGASEAYRIAGPCVGEGMAKSEPRTRLAWWARRCRGSNEPDLSVPACDWGLGVPPGVV